MEALGFDLKYFLFQLVNFVVLLVLLRMVLHKPLTALMDKRRVEIQEGLENAEKMKLALAETETKQQALLEEARLEARQLVEETRGQAKELEAKLQQEAAAQAASVLERAQEELAAEREQFRQELRAEMANLVLTATEKVLDGTVSVKEKQAHIEKLVKELS